MTGPSPRTGPTAPGVADVRQLPRLGFRDHVFSQVLAEAMERSGKSMEAIVAELRERGLRTSLATLSYWRSGRSIPAREGSLAVVEGLEQVLGTAPGELRGALPNDAFQRWDPVALLPYDDQMLALLHEMGLDPFGRVQSHIVHDRAVWRDRQRAVETSCELMVALVDGVDRLPMGFQYRPENTAMPLLVPRFGCDLGRVVELDDRGLVAIEMLLPRPMAKGELFYLEYDFLWDYELPQADSGVERTAAVGIPFVGSEVEFDGWLPQRVTFTHAPYQGIQADAASRDEFTTEVEPCRWTQRTVADMAPGQMSLWWFDEGGRP